jgi:anti-sigma factor RsiW
MRAFNCQEVVCSLEGYLAGALAPAELEAFESHVDSCTACQEILSEERRLIQLVRKAVDVHSPRADELIARIRERLGKERG